jgi:glycosyltransferase involved in cell wall biosynthesis
MKGRSLKILIPTTSFIRNKDDFFNIYIFRFAKALAESGMEVVVLAPDDKETKTEEVIDGVRIVRFQYFFKKHQCLAYGASGIPHNIATSNLAKFQIPFFLLAFLKKIITISRSCDLIHAQWLPSALLSLPAKYIYGKPVILTEHNANMRHYPKSLCKFVVARVNAITTAHPDIADIIRGWGRKDIQEIPNMLDIDSFKKTSETRFIKDEIGIGDEKVVTFIARIEDWKGPLTFIESIPHIIKKRDDLKFLLVGDGNLIEKIRYRVKELAISKFVKVLGPRKDVNNLLSISHVFTALSKIENIWSTTVIEAMVLGIPCILTDVGYTAKVLEHMKNCYIVEAGERVEERVAEAALFLLDAEELREKISGEAKLFLEEKGFSKKNILQKFIGIYQSLADCHFSKSMVIE